MQCIALDCEMVGVAPRYVPGRKPKKQSNMVARVVIVNDSGRVLYDSLVAPQELIIDYRTHISGVRPGDLDRAPSLASVQTDVLAILKDKILVGHSLKLDLKVLQIDHPEELRRDTAEYSKFSKYCIKGGQYPALRRIASGLLGIKIQSGTHCPIEDARTALKIYQACQAEWERDVARAFP
ncbi:RNA exonuclease 4-like [Oscarella lobularis]|uniref:RNA exonuclease 4-like n=1 Tax=Oscarella lobularis TaxID=121494 RepID=UPI0033133226